MRTLIALAFLLVACSPPQRPETAPAAAASAETVSAAAPAPPAQPILFQAPTGNIGCVYTPAGGTAVYHTADNRAELQCDRVAPTYVRIALSDQGAARIVDTQERGCCGGETISYGDSWSDGPFICEIHQANVICRNTDNHGFTLSRTQQDVH